MTFMDSLDSNPTNNQSSGIYGQPKPTSNEDVLSVVNKLKDREMQDFQSKANFMSELSLRQEQRMRNLFGPEQSKNSNAGLAQLAHDPSAITEFQKGELGIRQQELGQKSSLDSQRLSQQGKLGQESLDIKTQQEKLNQQKSDQAHEQKVNELTAKQADFKQKMDLSGQQLQSKNINLADQLALHKTMAENTKAYHDAEMAKKDLERERIQRNFDTTSAQHEQKIKDAEQKIKDFENSSTTTELNPDGTKKTVTTKRGDAADIVIAIGKDGKRYPIPKDKLNDKDADGTPHWKAIGGGQ